MIFYQYDRKGGQHVVDFTDVLSGRPAFLVGGAPSLKEQNYKLLETRGVVTFAINNVGGLFRPTYMVSCDTPRCFDPKLLLDPTLIKFGWNSFAMEPISDKPLGETIPKYMECPNQFFFDVLRRGKDSRLLQYYKDIPWKNNSLFAAICILRHMGVNKMFLAGSDFGPNKSGEDYSVGAKLDSKEKIWNDMLYKSQVRDLIKLKPVFEEFELTIVDTSKNTKLSSVYPTCTIEDGVAECLKGLPSEYATSFPHVSQMFPGMADKVVAGQYAVVDEAMALKETLPSD